MAKLHRSETAKKAPLWQTAVIRDMIGDLKRTVQILSIDICAEEERACIFDRSEPAYPILARTLTARRDNLNVTIACLAKRLHAITLAAPTAEAA
jgi:hypothetical protein